jgi:hypothetical protein
MNTQAHYLAGLGQTGAQIAHAGTGVALSTGASIALAAGGPIGAIAAGVLGVASAIQNFFFQPDLKKIATTQIVNRAEILLQQNLAAWNALPPNQKTAASQAQAVQNFDTVWAQVMQACGSGQYGSAGQNCISDRQQGSCHFQNSGQCWNWFIGYRDPIANDPQVVANQAVAASASPIASALSAVTGATGLDPTLLLAVGLGLVAVVVIL